MAKAVILSVHTPGPIRRPGEGGKMKSELLKELWEKGIAYLLQEYT